MSEPHLSTREKASSMTPVSREAQPQLPDTYRADGQWHVVNQRTGLSLRTELTTWCKREDVETLLASLASPAPQEPLTLSQIMATNVLRAARWHPGGLAEWSPLEWAGAMAGEAGEACNAAKKLKRIDGQLQNINTEEGRSLTDRQAACHQIAKEVADTIIYGVLLVAAVGEDIEAVLVDVFNKKSEEYGFPERLVLGGAPLPAEPPQEPLLIEALAAWDHSAWSHWTQYLIDHFDAEHVAGWRRQIQTGYADLSEAEKESDRKEAREILAVLRLHNAIMKVAPAEPQGWQPIDNGNPFIFCDVVDGKQACVRGAGHNGPHAFWIPSGPPQPVMLRLPAPPAARGPA